MQGFWEPFFLSIELASYTSVILFTIAIPLCYLLTMYSFHGQSLIRAIITIPLILPPSVLGYYLLVAFRPNSWLGQTWQSLFDSRLAFSFQGILIGSMIFSFPFMVNPILAAIDNLPRNLQHAAFSLGKSKWTTFVKVLLPNTKSAIITATILTFAHTIGEFGVILMIGGNIPKETRVASMAIYHELESMNYEMANQYALILLGFSLYGIADRADAPKT